MPEAGISVAADLAMATPYWNPPPLQRERLVVLLNGSTSNVRGTVCRRPDRIDRSDTDGNGSATGANP